MHLFSMVRSLPRVSGGALFFLTLILTAQPNQQAAAQTPQAPAETSAKPVIDIGSRLELFVDRMLIDQMKNLDLRLQTPQPQPMAKSPIVGDFMTVIKDGDLYHAWYRQRDASKPPRDPHGFVIRYAQSTDGHEWTFPAVGIYERDGSRDNNIVLADAGEFTHNLSPFLDTRPGVDPAERFKAFAGRPMDRKSDAEGIFTFVSPDGIHWKQKSETPAIAYDPSWYHAFDSQNLAFWSEAEQCYVGYVRLYGYPRPKSRTIGKVTSQDFIHWTRPVHTESNLEDEHLYTSQAHPYFRAPHIYIALPTRLMDNRKDATEIKFMTVRAGQLKFDRTFPQAFIRPGLDPERWKNRGNYAALNVVPTSPTEMSIYNSRSGVRYTLRTDCFASVHADGEEGEMVTRPFTFTGDELRLNYSTSASGHIKIEIQDEQGKAIPGFTLRETPPIIGDAINQPVTWAPEADLASLQGKPIRLRFLLLDADLYAMQFARK